ncbi:addiction module antidote protein [Pseudomonas japonica]|uniref:addiction module antidote protein n=1 Tax=Pseudomonas japonica TaxID=256466 RepID=UPI0015E372CE|nr:addiction module antidote protein [Pseudomonas japonica]MBA1245437.1 putative addiction module antidote protein [Pseudomonas japonica]
MKEPLYDYDPSAGLKGPEAIAIFLSDAFETGDAEYIAKALGIVARARGMKELAQETGLSRQQLYRSLSSHGNPTLKTLLAVTKALGVDITARLHPQPSGADTV